MRWAFWLHLCSWTGVVHTGRCVTVQKRDTRLLFKHRESLIDRVGAYATLLSSRLQRSFPIALNFLTPSSPRWLRTLDPSMDSF